MTKILYTLIQIGAVFSVSCNFGGLAKGASEGQQTVDQLRKDSVNRPSASGQSAGADQLNLPIQPAASRVSCPNPVAIGLFEHQIAYQRTEELNPLQGLEKIHVNVWERGHLTAFYVQEKLKEFAPSVRMVYTISKGEAKGNYTCPAEQNWKECVEKNAGLDALSYLPQTCSITLDISTIPAWKPSPNDEAKRRVADELRNEIEAKWPGVQQIVIRDFNLKDNQITMYLKMPDGDYYEGCGFHATGEPHCEGWHLFGNAPNSSIRQWIFEEPYRLK